MLEHMKNSALLQKAWRGHPEEFPLPELLACASEHGAKALGLDTGSVREGAQADVNIIDLDNVAFLSPGPVLANLVYAAHSEVITDVICQGRWVMRNRRIPGEEEILREARRVLKQI